MRTAVPIRGQIRRVRSEAEDRTRALAEVRDALEARPLPSLPSKYFYDERGSALFDAITRLPEYYLTRAEESVLAPAAGDAVARVRPRHLVELGSGLGRKVRVLLDAMEAKGTLESCTMLDVSEGALTESVHLLGTERPGLRTEGIVGDFLTDLGALGPGRSRLIAFLGSTIGNIHPGEVPTFFRMAASVLAQGDGLLLGLDLVKDRARLEAAYNDAQGVTAEFNRNILRVVNDRLGGAFEPDAFEHVAFYDEERAWIEMRLRARHPCRVQVEEAGVSLTLPAGGEIRTEISCKYTRASLDALLPGTGLRLEQWRTDAGGLFALALLLKTA
ncbi:MAG TPA: L-histidine N(alpha)-methyltransferase [Vicinamibacteria bacterium]|nr:L-histidine N(alpha)-methyltransferase [Vicinamibacteria bacterium]